MTALDAAQLLWTDADFEAPQRVARQRLVDIRATMATDPRGAHARAFCDQSARFLSADDARSARAWSDPRLYWWTATADELVRTEPLDAPAFTRHLDSFAVFVGEVSAPELLAPPLAIPGTGGALDEARPVARCYGYEVVVNPFPFALPDSRIAEPALAAGLSFHEQHVPLVERTLAVMAQYAPSTFADFRRVVRMIGLKPRRAGDYDDMSEPLLPGSFISSVVDNPLELADHFIHELQHNRLSFVEERGPLFSADQPSGGYYSPWRDNARSLYGVFHGVYVFLAVYRYWEQVLSSGTLDGIALDYARDRVARLPLQLVVGVRMLERYTSLTPLGATLLGELARRVTEVRGEAIALGVTVDAPAIIVTDDGEFVAQAGAVDGKPFTVGEALREHMQRHEAGAQCDGLVDDLQPFGQPFDPNFSTR